MALFLHEQSTITIVKAIVFTLLTILSPSSSSIFNTNLCYKSITNFGDSLSDTGNLVLLSPPNRPVPSAFPPYGETFFTGTPTGRFSDGRLIIDFIAEKLGLPFVPPYIAGRNAGSNSTIFDKGVNFAVVGATALNLTFFQQKGIINPNTNVSLGNEFDWFNQFLATNPNGSKYIQDSLFLVGSIGGNDYNYPLTQGRTIAEVRTYVPTVVNYIGSTIEILIALGVRTVIVPGILPNGCLPLYLTLFKSSNIFDYDPLTGCLKSFNDFSVFHNTALQTELSRLRILHPQVNIVYADFYNAAFRFYQTPYIYEFTEPLKACCGTGGSYNFNISTFCSTPQATSCTNPSSKVSWDGIHLTERAYQLMARDILGGKYAFPPIKSICNTAF